MVVRHELVATGTTATNLLGSYPVDTSVDGNLYTRKVTLTNLDATNPVFIGGPGVTTASYGYKLAAGASKDLDLFRGDVPYGVVAAGSINVAVLHLGIA